LQKYCAKMEAALRSVGAFEALRDLGDVTLRTFASFAWDKTLRRWLLLGMVMVQVVGNKTLIVKYVDFAKRVTASVVAFAKVFLGPGGAICPAHAGIASLTLAAASQRLFAPPANERK